MSTSFSPNRSYSELVIEARRLRLQSKVWEDATNQLLDSIGLKDEWACVDFGCGPVGILPQLSERVGSQGKVVGIDESDLFLHFARSYVQWKGLNNVQVINVADMRKLKSDFSLVHERFVLPQFESVESLLNDMFVLTKIGGVLAFQELDFSRLSFKPSHPLWSRLTKLIIQAFELYGNGARVPVLSQILRDAGLRDVKAQQYVLKVESHDPYFSWLVSGVSGMRSLLVKSEVIDIYELDALVTELSRMARFTDWEANLSLVQTWGIK